MKMGKGIVMYGDGIDKEKKSCSRSPTLEQPASGVPVVGPVWRGGIEVVGRVNGKLDGLEVFMPQTSYTKHVRAKLSENPSLCFSMKKRHALWPKKLKELEASHYDIGLFLFSQISRSETDYDNLVQHMISNDLAMVSEIGNLKLIIFTSLELQDIQQQTQGKYYLWGMLKGQGFRRRKISECNKSGTGNRMTRRCIGKVDGARKPNTHANSPLSRRIVAGPESRHSNKCQKTANGVSLCSDSDTPLSKIKIILKKKAHGAGAKWTATLPSLRNCSLQSSLSQGRKRARTESKECRSSPTINEGQTRTDQPSTENCIIDEADQLNWDSDMQIDENACEISQNCIINEIKLAEQHSWDSDMEIDEPSESSAFHSNQEANPIGETKEAEHPNWGSDMEIDEPIESSVVNRREEDTSIHLNSRIEMLNNVIEERAVPQPHSEVTLKTDTEAETCLAPFLNSEELAAAEVSNPPISVETDSCSNDDPDTIVYNAANANNQNNVKDTVLRSIKCLTFNECAGVQPECNGSQEKDSEVQNCLTPFLKSDEISATEVCNLAINVEGDPCLDANPESILCNNVNASNHNYSEDVILKLTVASTGDGMHELSAMGEKLVMNATFSPIERLEALPPRTQFDPECQASELPESDICKTPLIDYGEQSGASTPSTATVVLELDEEEEESTMKASTSSTATVVLELDKEERNTMKAPTSSTAIVVLELDKEEESTKKGTGIFRDGSDMVTSSSMLNMAVDFQETASASVRVQVGRYTIRSDLAPIVRKILDKHGDIAFGCFMMPEVMLEEISKALQDLESVSFSGLRFHHLQRLRNLCQLGEAIGFNVKWLSTRCEDLEKLALQLSQYLLLKKENAECNKTIQSLEEKVNMKSATVTKLLEENISMAEQFESLKERQQKLHSEIEYVRSSTKRFLGRSLADQLF